MDTSRAPEYIVCKISQSDNGIGGFVETSQELFKIRGCLDLITGDERYTNNTPMEESTHILITDYRKDITTNYLVIDEDNNKYEVTLVDDPVKLHHHLEIYLKFIGDRNV